MNPCLEFESDLKQNHYYTQYSRLYDATQKLTKYLVVLQDPLTLLLSCSILEGLFLHCYAVRLNQDKSKEEMVRHNGFACRLVPL